MAFDVYGAGLATAAGGLPAGVAPFTLGGTSPRQKVCRGDRLIVQNFQIAPDSPAGADVDIDADGQLPYLAYQPDFSRLGDYATGTRERDRRMFGNAPAKPPIFRCSLSSTPKLS